MKDLLLIATLLFGQVLCFAQNSKAKQIDTTIEQSEVGKTFLLEKSCIDLNKDTINYYKDTGKCKLTKVTHTLYNPEYPKDLRKDFWTYYFLNGNLIMVTNGHIVDLARVYSYTNYYFDNRKYFYRFGIKYNLQRPDLLLKQGDEYLKEAQAKACM